MKLPAPHQQIVDELIAEAHVDLSDGSGRTVARDVAHGIVSRLHDLEGSGEPWVAAYVDSLTTSGAQKVYSDWRRRYEIEATTKTGTAVTVPAFGGVRTVDDEGQTVYQQMRIADMPLAELRALRDARARMRNTLSAEIKVYDALIELMVEGDLACAGDALALIQAAA